MVTLQLERGDNVDGLQRGRRAEWCREASHCIWANANHLASTGCGVSTVRLGRATSGRRARLNTRFDIFLLVSFRTEE
jgi:hypothetical protein